MSTGKPKSKWGTTAEEAKQGLAKFLELVEGTDFLTGLIKPPGSLWHEMNYHSYDPHGIKALLKGVYSRSTRDAKKGPASL